MAVLTQKEKEQRGDKAGFSWRSTAGLSSCLLTAPWEQQRHQSPGALLFHHKTASLVAALLPSFLPHNIPKISIISTAGFPIRQAGSSGIGDQLVKLKEKGK